MYARGILFGKMKYELGDHSFVRCPELGLVADLEFKTKGYFGGTYNAIGGFIKETKTDKALFELSGHWNEEMYIKDLTVCQIWTLPEVTSQSPYHPRWNLIVELTGCRLARRNSCSMRHMQEKLHPKLGLSTNKTNANRNAYGRTSRKRSRRKIRKRRLTRSRKSKTGSVKRPPRG
jgi:hypothetical protein